MLYIFNLFCSNFFIDFCDQLHYNISYVNLGRRKETTDCMKTRILSLVLVALLLFIAGCSDNEVYEPPPEPARTVSPPPEPEPEPECDHFWKRPDCHNPSICLDCGETQGLPLEHVLADANYQQSPECVNCGDIYGEPLESNFVRHGLRVNATAGRSYDYITITNLEPELTTIGTAALLYVDVFNTDEGYPAKAGYEYIVARLMITFDDENARNHGFQYLTGQVDYYGFDPDEIAVIYEYLRDSDIPDFKIASRKLNFFGEDYEYYMKHTQIQNEWVGDVTYLVIEYAFLVPVGFDGLIVYVSNAANWSEASNRVLSDNFDNDTLFFRLRSPTS